MLGAFLLFAIATSHGAEQRSPASTIEFAYGDAKGADLTAWVLDTKAAVRKRWALPYEARRRVGHAALTLTVDRTGWVVDTGVEIASDIPGFDDSAIVAIRAAKLLPLPDDYPDERFALTLVFWFNEPPFDVFDGERTNLEVAVAETLSATPPPESQPSPEIAPEAPSREVSVPDRVYFTDGTSLPIDRYETRGDLVILQRRDGRLQSVPRAFVDWEKTLRER
jgi:TonB family protein